MLFLLIFKIFMLQSNINHHGKNLMKNRKKSHSKNKISKIEKIDDYFLKSFFWV